ncbi:MAG: hypothetical protein ABGX27_06580 [Desulfurobacteriaceae bacterium]
MRFLRILILILGLVNISFAGSLRYLVVMEPKLKTTNINVEGLKKALKEEVLSYYKPFENVFFAYGQRPIQLYEDNDLDALKDYMDKKGVEVLTIIHKDEEGFLVDTFVNSEDKVTFANRVLEMEMVDSDLKEYQIIEKILETLHELGIIDTRGERRW